jgi:beta-galactosidase
MQNRREFLQSLAFAVPALNSLPALRVLAQQTGSGNERFLFGADVYPDIESAEQTQNLLALLEHAHMNVVRVGESSWGNLETGPGQFNFGWLRTFLGELHRRGIWAILGTSTFIPPQWLAASHPETLIVAEPGLGPTHPMSRHCPCLNHPLYREACRRYIQALAAEFHDHQAVIGWQLDNELEFMAGIVCYNPACERAWRRWLETTYRTPEEFNRRLELVDWGMKVQSFDDVPQPRYGMESARNGVHEALPALSLAEYHFRRDTILDFLAEQAAILRKNGVSQWILTDWNPLWTAVADEPAAQSFMSIAGLNYYQPSVDNAESWNDSPWQLDMHRSCYQKRRFIVTETRFGVMGGATMWDPAPSKAQFHMWDLQLAAFGAAGMLYWSGNRWRGGHWPQWGGLLDWSGRPEPDTEWAAELGQFFNTWGRTLLANPVNARAVAYTDFDSRTALDIYPPIPHSRTVFTETFAALHRLGIGVDTINARDAAKLENLKKYDMLLLPAAIALDDAAVVDAIRQFVEQGGTLVVTPFTGYTNRDGILRGDGFAANLAKVTGGLVRTIRWTGSPKNGEKQQLNVRWNSAAISGTSPVGLDGYIEFLEIQEPETRVIAAFASDQPIVDGKPAATIRSVGRGQVIKLAFWPADSSFITLIDNATPLTHPLLAAPIPDGVLAVPRTDNSLFLMNGTSQPLPFALKHPARDRISGHSIEAARKLAPYEVLWLEA